MGAKYNNSRNAATISKTERAMAANGLTRAAYDAARDIRTGISENAAQRDNNIATAKIYDEGSSVLKQGLKSGKLTERAIGSIF